MNSKILTEGKKLCTPKDKKPCDFHDESYNVWELNSVGVGFKYKGE